LAPIIYGIVFAPKNTFIRSIFSHPASVYVGKLSYSLYLYHYAAFMIASWCAVTYGFPMYGVSWLLVGIPLTIIGATFSYHLVETQFFRLRRRFGSTV
jgi:peptidoglycan/LPS O-acetylase OafA/YrhL